VLVAVGILFINACGSVNRELQARVAQEALGVSPPVEDDEAVVKTGAEVVEGRSEQGEDFHLSDDAGFEDYVAAALTRNPGVHQAIRNVQLLGYRVPQVTSLEDPMITLIPPTGDMTETAAGMMDGQVGISQRLPFPGRLSRRGKIAEQEVRMAFATLVDVRVRTISSVATAYYDYYLADVSIDITQESEQLLGQIREVAAARYRAGTATQQDVLRAEVELYSLTNDLITLEQRRATAQARLNVLINRPVESPLPPPQGFALDTVEWKLPAALDQATEANPQLVRLREQIKRDLQAIKLARLEYFPDLRVGFSYTFIGSGISPVATGNDNWSLPFGLNLPIWWQRIRAGILEANARTLSSVAQFEDMRNMIFFALQDTLVKIDTQYRQAVLFRDLLVPRAVQTVEVSTAGYRAGNLEFTALVDNWRNWLKFSLAYHQALAGLEQRFADLQQLIGARVPRHPASDAEAPASAVEESTTSQQEGGIEE
jgi:outer membrane protein TolC